MKPSGWLESVNCAIEGVLWAVRSQRHMRVHLLAAITVLLTALVFRVTVLEFILLVLAACMVLIAELVNTALETLVDLIQPEFHELARRTKDVAAGAVLVASVAAVVVGYLVLSRHVLLAEGEGFQVAGPPPGILPVVAVLATTLLVILIKACWGRGSPLHGGMPSGHAAVAFAIATAIALAPVGTVLAVLVVALAAMVSHSRLLLGIHSFREVLSGALLGAGTTLILYLVFSR